MTKIMARSCLTGLALIVLALYSLCSVKAEQKLLSGLEWDVWFERLSGQRQFDLEGPVIMRILMRLGKGSYQQINPIRKSIVDFWLDANVGNQEHCSRDYLAKLESEREKLKQNGFKRDDVYTRTIWRVIANCYNRLEDGVSMTKTLSGAETESIFKLGSLWQLVLQNDGDSEGKWNLGNYIGNLVGSEARKDQRVFVNTWREGICARLLAELDDQDMAIEAFLATFDYTTRKNRNPQVNQWVTGIEACKYLQTDVELSNVWPYVLILPHDSRL